MKTICPACFSNTTVAFKQTRYCANFSCRYHFTNYITMKEYVDFLRANKLEFGTVPV